MAVASSTFNWASTMRGDDNADICVAEHPSVDVGRERHATWSGLPASVSAGIRLYGHADLVALPQSGQRATSSLVRDLIAANSPKARERVIRDRLDSIGFDWLEYHVVSDSSNSQPHSACMVTYALAPWTQRYFVEGYCEVDPRQAEATRSSLPLVWDLDYVDQAIGAGPRTNRAQRFAADLRDSGMGSGIFLRVPKTSTTGVDRVMISLGSCLSTRRWIDEGVLGEALVLGLSLSDYMSNHVQLPVLAEKGNDARMVQSGGLPAVQQRLLDFVACGLTDREIAMKLCMSLHAVDYHLRRLRQHFAVHNRVQLVAAAALSALPAATAAQ